MGLPMNVGNPLEAMKLRGKSEFHCLEKNFFKKVLPLEAKNPLEAMDRPREVVGFQIKRHLHNFQFTGAKAVDMSRQEY